MNAITLALRETYGWDVSRYDGTFLAKSLAKRLAATALPSARAYQQRVSEDRTEAEAFLGSLNITYSEFFRGPLTFALLEQLILPRLVETREKAGATELRVWSAGCAAGQEAWSVAILLEDLAVARGRPIPFRIIATDVSDAALASARQGVYDQTAVHNVRLRHLRDYFTAQDQTYVIAPRLRARVDFSTYDLLDERSVCPPVSLYGDFDLIFCSNLLFYYRQDLRQQILDKVCRALAPDGYLVTGEAERDLVNKQDGLCAVAPPSAVFHQRKGNRG